MVMRVVELYKIHLIPQSLLLPGEGKRWLVIHPSPFRRGAGGEVRSG
jgi:hypothetical protein